MRGLTGYLKKILYLSSLIIALNLLPYLIPKTIGANTQLEKHSSAMIELDNTGKLISTYTFRLHNKSQLPSVLTNFSFNIPFTEYSSLKIFVNDEGYSYKAQKRDSDSLISITLPSIVIGVNNSMYIKMVLEIPDYIEIDGENLHLVIPPISSFISDEINLTYPSSFGEVIWSSVSWEPLLSSSSRKTIVIDSNSSKKTLSMVIGNSIAYNFKINKEFTNETDSQTVLKVSLPREGDGQSTLYNRIEPLPTEIEKDDDGNVTASYLLSAGEKIIIQIDAYIFYSMQNYIIPENLSNYLKLDGYWQFNSDDESKRAQIFLRNNGYVKYYTELSTQEEREEYVKSLYNYTLSRLSPIADDHRNITIQLRRGVQNLQDTISFGAYPDDYTDFFIALLRKLGVPARMSIGYITPVSGYQSDSFLHSWVEVWNVDTNRWDLFDPALESYFPDQFNNTSLDRISIVSRSVSSVRPHLSLLSNEELSINLANDSSSNFASAEISFEVKEVSAEYITGLLKIRNNGNTILQLKDIFLQNDNQTHKAVTFWSSIYLVPSEENEIEVAFSNVSSYRNLSVVGLFMDLEGNEFKRTATFNSDGVEIIDFSLLNIIISFIIFTIGYILLFKIFSRKKVKKNGK